MPQNRPTPSRTPGAAAGATAAVQSYWRSFPVLEKLLSLDQPPLLDQIGATCQALDGIQKAGTPQEKARARDAMTAYARALELYQELLARRNQIVAETSNTEAGLHEKSGRGDQ
jgi:uncharacterized membrane protein YccC